MCIRGSDYEYDDEYKYKRYWQTKNVDKQICYS